MEVRVLAESLSNGEDSVTVFERLVRPAEATVPADGFEMREFEYTKNFDVLHLPCKPNLDFLHSRQHDGPTMGPLRRLSTAVRPFSMDHALWVTQDF
jgi:hypothetical protein